MVVEPRVKDFICTTAHPVGCAQNVKNQIEYVKSKGAVTVSYTHLTLPTNSLV